jgi:hypothetical protein
MTADEDFYSRKPGPKGELNKTRGRPIILTVTQINNGVDVSKKSVFNVGETRFEQN